MEWRGAALVGAVAGWSADDAAVARARARDVRAGRLLHSRAGLRGRPPERQWPDALADRARLFTDCRANGSHLVRTRTAARGGEHAHAGARRQGCARAGVLRRVSGRYRWIRDST